MGLTRKVLTFQQGISKRVAKFLGAASAQRHKEVKMVWILYDLAAYAPFVDLGRSALAACPIS